MNFLEPVLARCTDRTVLAKENPVLPSPQSILSNDFLSEQNLIGVSFDYFIDWTSNQLNKDFWLKCPFESTITGDLSHLSDDDITHGLRGHQKFMELVAFSSANACSASAIVFDDCHCWNDEETSSIIIARWPKDPQKKKGLEISRLRLSQVKELIKFRSGGPFPIGKKGLQYGTSCLECHLSKTDALWPGDVDLLLCGKSSMKPIAIIELKKHTESSKKNFRQQKLSNYYPGEDGPKYDRLALLSQQISPGRKIKIFTLYYSTLRSELSVRLEEIVGTFGSLIGQQQTSFNITVRDPVSGYRKVIEEIAKHSN
ncbi:hypothetical protein SAMN06265795_11258 [Noviherbaspirillum humi]|uniref:Uncharacterized protein n=1 Tax=Noviherbaspirillum humi TaxID=1688639 RepID=A0A239JBQ9_9BURK|nr:hypothetical protein [Noviherbaspirillum humi]SNT03249.1 hypothetical protein SAMN06265795_11258 [Noviherbaspirillum humi]